jgi:hypothetical protein
MYHSVLSSDEKSPRWPLTKVGGPRSRSGSFVHTINPLPPPGDRTAISRSGLYLLSIPAMPLSHSDSCLMYDYYYYYYYLFSLAL